MSIDAGLDPATAARRIAEAFLASGQAPDPPACLDREYSAGGGVLVCLRERESDQVVGRGGRWHFDPSEADPCRDLVCATAAAISESDRELSQQLLPELKIAVTFVESLRSTTVKELDLVTQGIVVASPDRRRLGATPPNAEHIADELGQYSHARAMARIPANAPHDLFSYTLTRHLEPGTTWPPFGVAHELDWRCRREIGEQLTGRAQAMLQALASGTSVIGSPIPNDLVPAAVFGVGVHLFHEGRSVNGIAWGASLDECLEQAVSGALAEAPGLQLGSRELAAATETVMVSILHDRQWLGECSLEQAATSMRAGEDAIAAVAEEGNALLLPMAMISENLSSKQVALRLLAEAGITRQPCSWALFPTASWLRQGDQVHRICHGFPERTGTFSGDASCGEASWRADIELLGSYLFHHLAEDGLPEYRSEPSLGRRTPQGDLAHRMHALIALDRAGETLGNERWRQAAADGFRSCLGHSSRRIGSRQGADDLAVCFLVAGISRCGAVDVCDERLQELVAHLRSLLRPDGRISSLSHTVRSGATDEHLPGAVLLALASFAEASGESSVLAQLQPCLTWYRSLFRLAQRWEMLCWQLQGWAALARLSKEPEQLALVWELADWAADRQHRRSGAFLTAETGRGFGSLTGRLLVAMADAWELAAGVGDQVRAGRYRQSCADGLRFLDRLIIRPVDTFCMPEPQAAVGGVRDSLAGCVVRVDNVGHPLLALAKCLNIAQAGITKSDQSTSKKGEGADD